MGWEVYDEYGMSATQQNAFIRIVENAIRRHGDGNSDYNVRYEVAKEIRNECRDEFPEKNQDWCIIYDTNGNFESYCSAYKRIKIKHAAKFDFVVAYRM